MKITPQFEIHVFITYIPFQSENVYFSVGSTKRVQCYSCLIPFDRVLAMSDEGTY